MASTPYVWMVETHRHPKFLMAKVMYEESVQIGGGVKCPGTFFWESSCYSNRKAILEIREHYSMEGIEQSSQWCSIINAEKYTLNPHFHSTISYHITAIFYHIPQVLQFFKIVYKLKPTKERGKNPELRISLAALQNRPQVLAVLVVGHVPWWCAILLVRHPRETCYHRGWRGTSYLDVPGS